MTVFSIERLFELCGRDISNEPVEAFLVMPMNPAEGRQLQLFNGFPGSWVVWSSNEFRLLIAIHGFSQSVVKTVANGPNGGNGTDLREALPIANGRELAAGVALTV